MPLLGNKNPSGGAKKCQQRDIYISILQTSRIVRLNNHNAMFDHVYQVHISTLG